MPQDKNPADQLTRILAAMGTTADRVAEVLRANGCRGFRTGNFPSPVIRYAYRWFDDGNLVLVYSAQGWKPDRLYLYRLDGRREEVLLPAAVAEFLALFDGGVYSDLDLALGRASA
ncbi:MAG: hypothetical protein JWO38_4191 [Gemmataceae bacterium]|nr:hypothetical protein [Gemmataceae bacterium]